MTTTIAPKTVEVLTTIATGNSFECTPQNLPAHRLNNLVRLGLAAIHEDGCQAFITEEGCRFLENHKDN